MLQSLVNIIYRYPRAKYTLVSRFGGYRNYRRMTVGRKQMERASMDLLPVVSEADGLKVYFLTGKKYLYQTLFCIHSLIKVSNARFNFTLVDDGSFDSEFIARVGRQLPGSRICTAEQIRQNLLLKLPADRFPHINRKRSVYPHIKKLTDIHTLDGDDWKLVLDSDMLFWHEPFQLTGWLNQPQRPLYMLDCKNSYGYSMELMEKLAGQSIPELLNVGVIGLNSKEINWSKIEDWIAILEREEKSSYYLEQALSAMIIGTSPADHLPRETYIVNPAEAAMANNEGVLYHYVDLSKQGYFTREWKKI